MNKEEFKDLVFYEIYPTSFYDSNNDGVGDLKGIEFKLDYIKDLGCNAIWFNPFYLSPFEDGGYDITNHKEIDPRFGNLDDFKSLLKSAHEKGIKIIVDLVPGHTSEKHPYFLKSGEPTRNEYSDLFIWTNNVWNYNPKYKLISGRHNRDGNYLVNFFSFQPALNFGFKDIDDPSWQMSYQDPRTYQARDFIIDIIMYWLEVGVDGFRVDMADSLVKNDDSKDATIEVWHYIFDRVKAKYPNAFFVSEWCNPEQSFKAGFDADFVLDHWDNFYHYFIRADEHSNGPSVIYGRELDFTIQDLLARYEKSKELGGFLANISGNHDVLRLSYYADNERIKLYYLLMFFIPGIPFIYYGDEIGMKYTNMSSKDGGYQRTGARTPMQWDKSKNYGFSSANETYLPTGLGGDENVEDALNDKPSLYYFVKELISIRHKYDELKNKEMDLRVDDRVITINRGKLKLVLNLTNHNVGIEGKVLISSSKEKQLLPYTGAIVEIQ